MFPRIIVNPFAFIDGTIELHLSEPIGEQIVHTIGVYIIEVQTSEFNRQKFI